MAWGRSIATGICLLLALAATPAAAGTRLASGTLVDARGAPTAGTLTAYAFPTGHGTTVLPVVARDRASAGGRFALATRATSMLRRLGQGNDGWVDILVHADTPLARGSRMFSVQLGTATRAAARASTDDELVVRASLAKPRAALGSLPTPPIPPGCSLVTKRVDGYKAPAVIGELNNAYSDTKATFTYGATADTDFGVAIAPAGEGWQLGGTKHVSTENGATVSRTRKGPYARQILSNFRFGKYRTKRKKTAKCDGGLVETEIIAEEWLGGLRSRKQSGTTKVCGRTESYRPGDVFTRTTEEAVTWTAGVTVFGIGLTTQSGFSQFVSTRFDFGGKKRKYFLCGDTGPATSAGRIYSGRAPS